MRQTEKKKKKKNYLSILISESLLIINFLIQAIIIHCTDMNFEGRHLTFSSNDSRSIQAKYLFKVMSHSNMYNILRTSVHTSMCMKLFFFSMN